MVRHMLYAHSLTFVLITGITPCDPFVLVPSTAMMSGLKDGDNAISMARLLMTGASTLPDNQVLNPQLFGWQQNEMGQPLPLLPPEGGIQIDPICQTGFIFPSTLAQDRPT